MLILSFGCLRFLRESCLLYAFLLGYLPSIFLTFLQNLLTFICRTAQPRPSHHHTDPTAHRITEHIIELRDAKSRNILGRFDGHRHHEGNQQRPLLLKTSIQPHSKRNEEPDVIYDPNSHRLLFQKLPCIGKEDKVRSCIP